MTGNIGDSIIICIINFEKYSLKRLYHECITRAYMLHRCNPVQTEIHLTQISREFSYERVQKLSKSIFAAYGAQVADLPLTGT